ncbi:MAG: sigma-70 family RNA polymerase sigma factor [Opitutaceae bacterium]|nr:sigma-70 family RNA polymerase sigma factor [Opitutaceae bacterium]
MSTPRPAPESSSPTEHARWFAQQVQPHEAAIRGYLRHRFPSVDTDDVVQESYLKLLRIRATGRIASAKAYFFSVAQNTARKLFRRRQQLYAEVPVNELPDWRVMEGEPDAAEATNARQRLELAARAVDRLPQRCREIVQLAIVHGLSNAEIAERLGLSEATVRVQKARAIRKCAHFLRQKGEIA